MGLVFWWVFIASEKDLSHLPKHTRSEDPKAVLAPGAKDRGGGEGDAPGGFRVGLGLPGFLLAFHFRVPSRVPTL